MEKKKNINLKRDTHAIFLEMLARRSKLRVQLSRLAYEEHI